jgi:hypothetical protein
LIQFIHVPPLDKPYSAQQMSDAIGVVIRGIIEQILP